MKRYIVGSTLLQLNNRKDIDCICIVDELKQSYRKNIDGYDCDIHSIETLKNSIAFDIDYKNVSSDIHKKCFQLIVSYQCDYRIIKQDFPFHYDILENKEKVIEFLRYVVKNKWLNFNKNVRQNRFYCSKIIYHFAYTLFIMLNNDVNLTEEQRAIIQKIHDIQMPIEYLDELKKLLDELI